MNWLIFPYCFYIIVLLWALTFIFLFSESRSKLSVGFCSAGIAILAIFISMLWLKLGRPPMRTLGETRLWYSFFLSFTGLILFLRWKYRWLLQLTLAFAFLFLTINFLQPETHEKTLMPALQSIWFIPHVIVYILSYALMAVASLVSVYGLYKMSKNSFEITIIELADNLVYLGFAFLTFGLVFGAMWAKEAWGDYWTWDPKESWALLTWLGYLIYIHIRFHKPNNYRSALWVLALSFIILLMCWFGINYLPSAQNSVHVYAG